MKLSTDLPCSCFRLLNFARLFYEVRLEFSYRRSRTVSGHRLTVRTTVESLALSPIEYIGVLT